MKIFLLGMPTSGKSTLAKEFAKSFGFNYIDVDTFIEEKHQLSITKIFNKLGENKFREFEHEALKEILKNENVIVATGGGLPCFYNNIEMMNEFGKTLYLKVSPKTLQQRLLNDENIRPLIKGKSENEVLNYLELTLKEREKFYKQASFIINAEKSIDEQINSINSLIKNL